MSSLPPTPAFYKGQPRASFFSRIMADRFNKVGNCSGTIIHFFVFFSGRNVHLLP